MEDFVKLKEIAEEILPDEVIIAAPGDKWPDDVKSEIIKIIEALKVYDIKVLPRLLSWFP